MHRQKLMPNLQRPLFAILPLLLSANAIAATPPMSQADCTREEPTQLFAKDTLPDLKATAYWLDANNVQWPGADRNGKYQLRMGDRTIALNSTTRPLPNQFRFIEDGPRLQLSAPLDQLTGDITIEQVGTAKKARLQNPGFLDARYAKAAAEPKLGVTSTTRNTGFKLWAPTAQQVGVCVFNKKGTNFHTLQRNDATGTWATTINKNLKGQYYLYLVDVFVPGTGLVRNRVTDPYSISLNANSQRSWIGNLDDASLKPKGWDTTKAPNTVKQSTDMVIYELHVRDFSRDDESVPKPMRGKYVAFTQANSNGMKHLKQLAKSGLTDVHLLPVFDFATLPEKNCIEPTIPNAARDSEAQQDVIAKIRDNDCYNWGYEPYHFNATEGSYATDADDGAKRIIEFRQMVQALHKAGLRVGMDVVYNHTSASGQHKFSVLDKIVPGYYHRLNNEGIVERSTCCDNTATEHRMMGKLLIDSVNLWTKHYKIDGFRFDLMAHQPRDVMEESLKQANQIAAPRKIQFLGEGWNFGEIADGKRFVQASQLSLNGSGIGTFSDRARDAVRGGSAGDSGEALTKNAGFIHGRLTKQDQQLWNYADWIRIGLIGSLRSYPMPTRDGKTQRAERFDYNGQPAAYVSQPQEVVNYVENHDNQTLFDLNAIRMPSNATSQDRVHAQMLAIAINALSQGVAYFHAGIENLRSKSLDRNSYNSGDWFNRIDWTGQTNFFGTGLPPKWDNEQSYPQMRTALNNSNNTVSPQQIQQTQNYFNDMLAIRKSSKLFRLEHAEQIQARVKFPTQYVQQDPTLIVATYDGSNLAGANFKEVMVIINAEQQTKTIALPNGNWSLHPVQASANAADPRPRNETKISKTEVTAPAYTTVVLVR